MNGDKLEGTARDTLGQAKSALGGAFGDDKTQAEGKMDQASGKLQHAYGSAKSAVQDAVGDPSGLVEEIGDFVQERPVLALLSALGVGYVLGRLLD